MTPLRRKVVVLGIMSRMPVGGLLSISSVTPNADRWAASARNFRCRNDAASNDTAIISGAVPNTSGSRPSVMPRPRVLSARPRKTSHSIVP